ncbi:MAG: hypothetical protein J5715_10230 [Clostridiales bacterium]|nr:hypothetical protein [Clostridiales bacterium]
MQGYLIETHLHTSEASACGKVSGSDYIDFMISRGFNGMIVTDHFFNGNCAVPRDLSWDKRVDWYMSGYEKALAASKGKPLDVFFGVEFNFDRDEYLIYGVDRRWLLENDDILDLTRDEVYKRVHEAGAIMVNAHPYRERYYIDDIKLMPSICDGIEIYNAANPDNQNALGYQYAVKLGLPMTAGSDIHFFHDNPMGGMLLPDRITDVNEYKSAVMARQGVPVKVDLDKITPVEEISELLIPSEDPTLPIINL